MYAVVGVVAVSKLQCSMIFNWNPYMQTIRHVAKFDFHVSTLYIHVCSCYYYSCMSTGFIMYSLTVCTVIREHLEDI